MLSGVSIVVQAAEMKIEVVLKNKQQIRMDFADGSKRFVLLVQREGVAEGTGPFAGSDVVEIGMHDIRRGVEGDPRGYLQITNKNGDIAYIKFLVRVVFVPGPNNKPRGVNNGFWEIVGGTGSFKDMKGTGTLRISPVTKTDRKFTLEGVVVPAM